MRQPLWPISTVDNGGGPTDPWEPFESPEKMAMMPPKLREAAEILKVGVDQLSAILDLYEIATALNDRSFLTAIRGLPCHSAVHNCIVSSYVNIYVGLTALFDDDQRTVNLLRASKLILLPSERQAILDFHGQASPEAAADAERMMNKMTFIQRRMNKKDGRFQKSLANLANARNKRLAHFNYTEGKEYAALLFGDIKICIVNAARLSDLACRVLVQRAYLLPEIRKIAQSNALELRAVIFTGAAARVPKPTSVPAQRQP